MESNYQNETMKRKYGQYLEKAKGFSPATLKIVRRTLAKYDEFSQNSDYKKFNIDQAIAYKKYLDDAGVSISGKVCNLSLLQRFYKWLITQNGYKHIDVNSIDYLQVSKKETALNRAGTPRKFPSLDYVRKLASSIIGNTEVEMRDRALISFTCLTGMRDNAIASLPLLAFDRNSLVIYQNPKYGVRTKFTKNIVSKVFRFDDTLLKNVLQWYDFLQQKRFSLEHPLFPRTATKKTSDNLSFQQSNEVEPIFWKSGAGVRCVFKDRAAAASLPYFAPHTFRHLAITLAMDKARSGEEVKAISQNFGHEHIATTMSVYGNYQPEDLITKLRTIDERKEERSKSSEKIEQILEIIQRR